MSPPEPRIADRSNVLAKELKNATFVRIDDEEPSEQKAVQHQTQDGEHHNAGLSEPRTLDEEEPGNQ